MPKPFRFAPLVRGCTIQRALGDCWTILHEEIAGETRAFRQTRMARMDYRESEMPSIAALYDVELAYTRTKFLGPFDGTLDA